MPSAAAAAPGGRRRGGGFSVFEQFRAEAEREQHAGAPTSAAKSHDEPASGLLQKRISQALAPPPRALSADDVKELLEGFRAAVATHSVQKALSVVRSRDLGAFKKREEVARLLAAAWKVPLRKAGLRIDDRSFPHALAAVRAHSSNPVLRRLSEDVEKLLNFFPGALFGCRAGEMKGVAPAATEVKRTLGAFSRIAAGGAGLAPPTSGVAGDPPATPAKASTSPPVGASAVRSAASAAAGELRGRAMTLGEAKDILRAFREICAGEALQRDLAAARRRDSKAASSCLGRALAKTMEFYDFPATSAGFLEMCRGVHRHGWNLHVKTAVHDLERLLGVPLGSLFGIPCEGVNGSGDGADEEEDSDQYGEEELPEAQRPAPRPGEVEVVLRHAVLDSTIVVHVPAGATFLEVKRAAVERLGSSELLTKGRLVRKNGTGMFLAYKDGAFIGGVRDILVLGADIPLPPAAGKTEARARKAARPKRTPAGILAFADMGSDVAAGPSPSAAILGGRERPSLTRDMALALQRELRDAFAAGPFQRKLRQLEIAYAGSRAQFLRERNAHFLSVQSAVLPKYGFRGTPEGVLDMIAALGSWASTDHEMQIIGAEINELLGLETPAGGKAAGPKERYEVKQSHDHVGDRPTPVAREPVPEPQPEPTPRPTPPPAVERSLLVRHAENDQDEEVWLKAMCNWTLDEVRRAVSRRLGRDDVAAHARFVTPRPGGGGWMDLPGTEYVGSKRKELLVLGVSFPPRTLQVTISHAIDDAAPTVAIEATTSWRFADLRAALASKLGRDAIQKRLRFVFRPNGQSAMGAWAAFTDDERIGDRSHLHVLGVDADDLGARAIPAQAQGKVASAASTASTRSPATTSPSQSDGPEVHEKMGRAALEPRVAEEREASGMAVDDSVVAPKSARGGVEESAGAGKAPHRDDEFFVEAVVGDEPGKQTPTDGAEANGAVVEPPAIGSELDGGFDAAARDLSDAGAEHASAAPSRASDVGPETSPELPNFAADTSTLASTMPTRDSHTSSPALVAETSAKASSDANEGGHEAPSGVLVGAESLAASTDSSVGAVEESEFAAATHEAPSGVLVGVVSLAAAADSSAAAVEASKAAADSSAAAVEESEGHEAEVGPSPILPAAASGGATEAQQVEEVQPASGAAADVGSEEREAEVDAAAAEPAASSSSAIEERQVEEADAATAVGSEGREAEGDAAVAEPAASSSSAIEEGQVEEDAQAVVPVATSSSAMEQRQVDKVDPHPDAAAVVVSDGRGSEVGENSVVPFATSGRATQERHVEKVVARSGAETALGTEGREAQFGAMSAVPKPVASSHTATEERQLEEVDYSQPRAETVAETVARLNRGVVHADGASGAGVMASVPVHRPPEDLPAESEAIADVDVRRAVSAFESDIRARQEEAKAAAAQPANTGSMPEAERRARAMKRFAAMKPSVLDCVPEGEDCTVWIVIGGEEAGGILVRREQEITSRMLPARLSFGCTVEGLELRGNRLKYRRLRGDGPDFGWVSLKTDSGKALLVKFDEEEAVALATSADVASAPSSSPATQAPSQAAAPAASSKDRGLNRSAGVAASAASAAQASALSSTSAAPPHVVVADTLPASSAPSAASASSEAAPAPPANFALAAGIPATSSLSVADVAPVPLASSSLAAGIPAASSSLVAGAAPPPRGAPVPPASIIAASSSAKVPAAASSETAGQKPVSHRELTQRLRPTHVDQDPGEGRVWVVVGGEERGGILVRTGAAFESKPYHVRLATGTRIEELELQGNRLHYKRLRGDGPDFGWVNVRLNEKVLVELEVRSPR